MYTIDYTQLQGILSYLLLKTSLQPIGTPAYINIYFLLVQRIVWVVLVWLIMCVVLIINKTKAHWLRPQLSKETYFELVIQINHLSIKMFWITTITSHFHLHKRYFVGYYFSLIIFICINLKLNLKCLKYWQKDNNIFL